MKKFTHFIARSESGVAALEFALILPVMIIMLIGMVESWNVIRSDQKLQDTAFQVADLLTQNEEVSNNLIDTYADVANILMNNELNGTVIFSSIASVASGRVADVDVDRMSSSAGLDFAMVVDVDARPITPSRAKIGCKGGCVVWQRVEVRGAGATASKSNIGRPNGRATLPGGLTLSKTENLIAVEIFTRREPMLEISRNIVEAFVPEIISSTAVAAPRLDSLLEEPR